MQYKYAEWRPASAATDEYFYDPTVPAKAISFIEDAIVLPEGLLAGQKMTVLDWQRDILEKLLGTLRYSEEKQRFVRQYEDVFIGIARKNGKTTFIAALGLFLCALDNTGEKSNIIIAAATREQASIAFDAMLSMVRANPILAKAFKVQASVKCLTHIKSGGRIKVISADGGNALGLNPTVVIIDELVAQKNDELYRALKGSQASRSQPLFFVITTAGFKNKAKLCYELWQDAERTFADQSRNRHQLVSMRPVPDEADYTDEEIWRFANPSLGHAKSLEKLRRQFEDSQRLPSGIPEFRAFQLCQWVDSESSWLDSLKWTESARAGGPVVEELLAGRTCFVGLDLSSKKDLTAEALVFPGSPTDQAAPGFTVLMRYWGTQHSVNSRDDYMQTVLNQWESEGWITLFAGESIRFNDIEEQVLLDAQKFNIRAVSIDQWNASQMAQNLEDEGLLVVDAPQKIQRLDGPTKELEVLVADRKLYHGMNPILTWNVENVKITSDNFDRVRINKGKSLEKIDGVSALINALMVVNVEEEQPADWGYISW